MKKIASCPLISKTMLLSTNGSDRELAKLLFGFIVHETGMSDKNRVRIPGYSLLKNQKNDRVGLTI